MTAAYRICHVTSVHPLDDVRIVRKEVRSLVEAGYDVWVVGTEGRVDRSVGAGFVAVQKRYRNRLGRMSLHAARVARAALKVGADLYHLHDPELLPWIPIFKRRGAKVVYDAHEDYRLQMRQKYYLPRLVNIIGAELVGKAEDWIIGKGDAVVCATPSISERFRFMRAVTVRNFPQLTRFRMDGMRKPLSQCYDIVYVGTISRARGIIELLDALHILDGRARMKLVGNFGEPGLSRICQSHPGWGFVEFLGWLDDGRVIGILAECRAGIVTLRPTSNYLTSLPVKLFEYMAAGLPVIASDFPAWRELLGEVGCALFVDPRDPRGIAEAIQWLLDHPVEAEAMGRRGQEAIVEHFNWENEARALLELYRELLHE